MTNHSVASFNVKPTSEWMSWVIANQDWRLMCLTGKERQELLFGSGVEWSQREGGGYLMHLQDSINTLSSQCAFMMTGMARFPVTPIEMARITGKLWQNNSKSDSSLLQNKTQHVTFFSLQLFNISQQLPNFGINPWLAYQTSPRDDAPRPTATWSTQMLTVWDIETVGWCFFLNKTPENLFFCHLESSVLFQYTQCNRVPLNNWVYFTLL